MKREDVHGQLLGHLRYLKDIGAEYADAADPAVAAVKSKSKALEELWSDYVAGCQRCRLSEEGRSNIVFGEGNPDADLMFIGEGPGAEEDRQGLPFVGRAGKKLNEIIRAVGLQRQDVYIGNIVKCRPPGNRSPRPDEIRSCLPYLERQIAIIQPRVICALGTVAAQTLLNTSEPISRLREEVHSYLGVPLQPTFHPAYLLRNYTPRTRGQVWEDMQKVMGLLGITADNR